MCSSTVDLKAYLSTQIFFVAEGACGYGDLNKEGYGMNNVALSTAQYNNGLTYGACYEIQCDSQHDPKWCHRGSIIVTATNFCSPNLALPPDKRGWCNPPRDHFDLSDSSE
ncbi:hypothetical protein AMTR_s00110p00103570 [Amborella trichopoda]|uniref:Expansin n=1 Tax=Amborella trichopoda TaxID=13333 RepID=W1NXC5_AMBTC|nr:hypothetical protein AMTR_s00110p00103570 [Amborella trichopoda]